MSVDQRIREGLTMLEQKIPPPDTDAAFDVVERGARTRTRNRGIVASAAVAAAAAAVIGVQMVGGPTETPSPSGQPSVGPSQVTDSADLQGTWRTADRVSARDMAEHVRGHGEYRRSLRYFQDFPELRGQGSRLTLVFSNGDLVIGAGEPTLRDHLYRQTYSLDEDGVLWLRPLWGSGGHSRYTAVVDGDELELRFFDTNVDRSVGPAEKSVQAALFTTTTFDRVR